VARTGVLVKQARVGIFERALYKENILYCLRMSCGEVAPNIRRYSVPKEMTGGVFCVFRQLALDSSSLMILWFAFIYYPKGTASRVGESAKKPQAQDRRMVRGSNSLRLGFSVPELTFLRGTGFG
jgi:hypothetical protein